MKAAVGNKARVVRTAVQMVGVMATHYGSQKRSFEVSFDIIGDLRLAGTCHNIIGKMRACQGSQKTLEHITVGGPKNRGRLNLD